MSGISQILQQRQIQKLSPQQIQGIKMLELPTLQFEARVKQELEENPVLEEVQSKEDDLDYNSNQTLEDYIRHEEDSQSYKYRISNSSKDDRFYQPTVTQSKSLHDFLIEQLAYFNLTEEQKIIAEYVIGSLDDDGYLRRPTESIADDIAFTLSLEVSEEEVEQVIDMVHNLDPDGIGARNLAECLLIQLRKRNSQDEETQLAINILSNHYDKFVKKHYDKLMQQMKISEDQLRDAIDLIVSLNPKPANGYAGGSISDTTVVVPDFILRVENDKLELSLASGGIPELRINRSYVDMAKRALDVKDESQKEAIAFVKQKIDSAKWFISSIQQRQETLMKAMSAILAYQKEYFSSGDESDLKPMILKDIADRTGFDISTISRVVNSKYIQTPFGTFLLKYFFSEGLSTESGEEVSTREIKNIIEQLVKEENPREPMTDEALMQALQYKGFKIARRTVAKYREMLDIPVARLRKKL